LRSPNGWQIVRFSSAWLVVLSSLLVACVDDRVVPPPAATLVVLETASGEITIAVDEQRAPRSAGSFLDYVDSGLYNGAGFYRVVNPENDNGSPVISVIQGGVLDGERHLPAVPLETTKDTGIQHEDGVISLARGAPDSGSGAAFFICIGAQPSLDFGGQRNPDGLGFAAFGRVVQGMDVVHVIHQLSAHGVSDSPYTAGQILDEPVMIDRAYRKTP